MNREAFESAKDERAIAAAGLVGYVGALLDVGALPALHRETGERLVREYNEAHARMVQALDAAEAA